MSSIPQTKRLSTSTATHFLKNVPFPLMVEIFLFVPTHSLLFGVSLSCKEWAKLMEWEYFWQRKTMTEFPYHLKKQIREPIRYVPVMPGRWKLTYIVEYFNYKEKQRAVDETGMWIVKFSQSGQAPKRE